MTDPNLLEIKDIQAYYGSSHVLQGVSMTLDHGAISIVGRNGMGKTTLVKTIMGLVPARGGQIHLRGEEITNLKPYQIGSRGIGYVPQGRQLFPSLTVDEHLTMVARAGNGASEVADRLFDDRQTEPRVADALGGDKRRKQILADRIGQPRAVVGHRYHDRPVRSVSAGKLGGHRDRPVPVHRLGAVFHQVDDDLLDAVGGRFHQWQPLIGNKFDTGRRTG